MSTTVIEQALVYRTDNEPPRLQARSAGFKDAWLPEAERLVLGFGARPFGVSCPLALFALPLTAKQVAVVRVADRTGDADRGLAFHFLVIDRAAYERDAGDPFALAERLPPAWETAGELPGLPWPAESLPPRTVAEVQRVLRRVKAAALREGEDPEHPEFERTADNSESPALLGGAQVLVDGGKLVFERPRGDLELVAGLWTLLPYSTRCKLWPASFAFGNELGFDVVVVPRLNVDDFEGYTTEEQAAEYPPGTYEMALQTAAEAGDERELEVVFRRRNSNEVLRMALVLLVGMVLIVLVGQWFAPSGSAEAERRQAAERQQKAAASAGILAVGDPVTAWMMLKCGDHLWGGLPSPPAGAKK